MKNSQIKENIKMHDSVKINTVRVFPSTPEGGNPAQVCLNSNGLSNVDMGRIAAQFGYESAFVLPPSAGCNADFRLKFFVPKHEMEMCGHATIGALWMLRETRKISAGSFVIETLSGLVHAIVTESGAISISQPVGRLKTVSDEDVSCVFEALDLTQDDLFCPKVINAKTSRVKTLVPLKSIERLNTLKPNFAIIEATCERLGSTGLYPFAIGKKAAEFSARQFPRASGYPEDAATGIAASALAFGLLDYGLVERENKVIIRQGEAMNCPSKIQVSFEFYGTEITGCWLSGVCLIDQNTTIKYESLTE